MDPSELWREWGLLLTDKSVPHLNLHNAARILECDPTLKDSVYYDEFLQRVMRRNSPVREWVDVDDLDVTSYIQANLGLPRIGRDIVSQAVIKVAYKHKRNCVCEWFETLKHDGTARLESFFPDCFGAEESEYTGGAGRNFWLSLVARIYRPGCKVDNMIVLEGAQGVGKSRSLSIIGGEWYAEQHESATNPKAFAEILQGKSLIEISEMDSFSKAEVNRVKQTISCQSDRFRNAYARHAADHPRTCIFVGTTNRDDWNRDETGARRFWPIKCTDVNIGVVTANREQYYAEAVARFKTGETHWEMPLEATTEEQRARYSDDTWVAEIDAFTRGESSTTVKAIADKLGIPTERLTKGIEMRIGACLRFMRWERKKERVGTETRRVWVRKDHAD